MWAFGSVFTMLLPILLANLRTGNPTLDALLTSLLLAPAAHLPKIKAWVMDRKTEPELDPELTHVAIHMYSNAHNRSYASCHGIVI